MPSPPLGFRRGRRMTVTVGVAALSGDLEVNDFVGLDANKFAIRRDADGAIYGVVMEGVPSPPADGEATVLLDISEESIYEFAASLAPTQAVVGTSTDISGRQEVLTGVAAAPASNNVVIHEIKVAAGTVYASIVRDAVVPKAGA